MAGRQPTQSNGTVTLSQANNFSGNTALSGSGTLQLQNAGSIGSSALTLSGGTLQLRSDTANTTFTDASTTVSGSTTINVDQASSATGLTLLLGNISTAGNTITVTNGNSYNLTVGTVSSSAGSDLHQQHDQRHVDAGGFDAYSRKRADGHLQWHQLDGSHQCWKHHPDRRDPAWR